MVGLIDNAKFAQALKELKIHFLSKNYSSVEAITLCNHYCIIEQAGFSTKFDEMVKKQK